MAKFIHPNMQVSVTYLVLVISFLTHFGQFVGVEALTRFFYKNIRRELSLEVFLNSEKQALMGEGFILLTRGYGGGVPPPF